MKLKYLVALAVTSFLALPASAHAASGVVLLHCTPNANQQVDPILDYGISPTAHLHTPAGANAFSSTSTLSEMMAANTSCLVQSDHSMIWIPTPKTPSGANATITKFSYYLRTNGPTVQVPPNDLQVIGGNSTCTGTNCPAVYDCTRTDGTALLKHTIPTVADGCNSAGYVMQILSGQCWDGTHLGPGMGVHDTNTLSVSGTQPCPGVEIPRVATSIQIASDGIGGYLSSDVPAGTTTSSPGSTGHFDYVFGWKQNNSLPNIVNDCLNTDAFAGKTSCTEVTNPDGTATVYEGRTPPFTVVVTS